MERLIEVIQSDVCGYHMDPTLLIDVQVTELRGGMVVVTDCTVRATPDATRGEVHSVTLKAERIMRTEIDGEHVVIERSFVGDELAAVLEGHKDLEIYAERELTEALNDKSRWM